MVRPTLKTAVAAARERLVRGAALESGSRARRAARPERWPQIAGRRCRRARDRI